MSKEIRVNEPGAGDWIIERAGGVFVEQVAHSISTHDAETGKIRGGFVVSSLYGTASMSVHMAGDDERWCSRDLLRVLFHYVFIQLGVRKLIAPVASTNHIALALNLRAGYRLEAILENATPDGHLMLLTMERSYCRWLELLPKSYLRSTTVVGDV